MYMLAAAGRPLLYVFSKGEETIYFTLSKEQLKVHSTLNDEIWKVLLDENAIALIDDRPPIVTVNWRCKLIVSSSPDRDKYKHVTNESGDLLDRKSTRLNSSH